MEKTAKLKAQVKGAMTYPIITIIVAILVVGVILVFISADLQEMFEGFGSGSKYTKIVVAISDFAKDNVLYLIIGAVIFFLCL